MRYLIISLLFIWIFIGFFGSNVKAQTTLPHEVFLDSLCTMPWQSATFERNSSYWLRFNAPPSIPPDRPFFIEAGSWGKVVVYQVDRGNAINEIAKSGIMVGMHDKSYFSYRNFMTLTADTASTFLIKVKSNPPLFDGTNQTLKVYTQESLQREEQIRLMSQSFFFGIIIVMALYNLMIFFSVKDESYIYYVLSIVLFGLYFAFYYGFSIEYLWPESPKWNAYSFAVIVPLTNIARVYFTKTYLHTAEYVPTWDRFLNVSLLALLVPVLLGFGDFLWQWNILPLVVNIIGVLGIVVMLAMMIVSVVVYKHGYRPALWFFVAFALFNVGVILFSIREMGFLTDNFFTRYAVQIGAIAQVVLFSLGLASRLNLTRSMLAEEILEKEILKRKQETERKNLIESQRYELEQKVKERTKELEAALHKVTFSEVKLRELNKIKDKLFSIISHDLKTPLTTVASFLDLMMNHMDKLSTEELEVLSNKTKQALQNLTLLLDNLLFWSRMQLDYMLFNPVPISIKQTIEKTIKLFSLLIEEKQLTINYKAKVQESTAWGDKEMIAFVIRNLLHNAIKFTPRGGQISFATDINDGMLRLSIQDTGVGIEADHISHILDVGNNRSMQGTENEAGTGIGLIMCHEFVDRNGGELVISSNTEGTIVSFTIPLYSTSVL